MRFDVSLGGLAQLPPAVEASERILLSLRRAAVRGMVYYDMSGDTWRCRACRREYDTCQYKHSIRPVRPQCIGCDSPDVERVEREVAQCS